MSNEEYKRRFRVIICKVLMSSYLGVVEIRSTAFPLDQRRRILGSLHLAFQLNEFKQECRW